MRDEKKKKNYSAQIFRGYKYRMRSPSYLSSIQKTNNQITIKLSKDTTSRTLKKVKRIQINMESEFRRISF